MNESRTLDELRDALLPKLLSGFVRVTTGLFGTSSTMANNQQHDGGAPWHF